VYFRGYSVFDVGVFCKLQVLQPDQGRVSDPAQAALSGSPRKAPGFAGGYLLADKF
jgi:hypothetical protein